MSKQQRNSSEDDVKESNSNGRTSKANAVSGSIASSKVLPRFQSRGVSALWSGDLQRRHGHAGIKCSGAVQKKGDDAGM